MRVERAAAVKAQLRASRPVSRRLDELRDWTEELTEELNATWRKVQQAKQKMLRRGGYESEAARSGGHEEQSTKGEVYQIL